MSIPELTCKIVDCGSKGHLDKRTGNYWLPEGYCRKHHWRLKTHGDPLHVRTFIVRKCKVDVCKKQSKCRGYCDTHYSRIRTNGSLELKKVTCVGSSTSPLNRTYHALKQRCYNKKHKSYHRYGGRGILVADEWLGAYGFVNFREYVESNLGEKPTKLHSLDRIDNNKGYIPGNLRWASKREQAINRRKQKNNSSGATGVGFRDGKWYAFGSSYRRYKFLGNFDTFDDALAKRKQFELESYGKS